MQPTFITNDSEIPLLEGIYIKERNPPAAIQGAFLGHTAIAATAVRGPVGKIVECTSPSRVQEVFGGRDRGTGGAIASNLWQALLNKPFGKVLVARVAAAAAVAATHSFSDVVPTAILKVDAANVGAWGNDISAQVIVPSTDAVSGRFDLLVTYNGASVQYKNLDLTGSNDNTLQVVGNDDANWVKLTKLASGTPIAATASLTTGADGSVADSDYTATGGPMDLIAMAKDVNGVGAGCAFIAEYSSAATKTKMQTLAASINDRLLLVSPNDATIGVSAAATEVAGFTRSDRLVYCFNHPYTQDPSTASEILTDPKAWMASVLSQIDVDIHPGEEDTKPFLAGITRLYNAALQRGDYKTLKAAGICALEKDDGYSFVSGVTTSLTPGKDQITRRRMTDFLQISSAQALKAQVKKKNTLSRRKAILGLLDGFLGGLEKAERVVDSYVLDDDILNTDTQRGQGIERVLMRVRLINHILELVLETEIGTQVVIKERS
jgi:hypothetical protein